SHGFNWIPLRARDNLVPNAFSTACNVWHTTFNPITTEMISTGSNIPKNYYGSGKKTGSMNQVYKFHNQVKSLLIQQNCKKGDRVMELGCGEMARWVGKIWDEADAFGLKKATADNGLQTIEMDAGQRAYYKDKTSGIEAAVIAEVDGAGVDGAEALAYLKSQLN
ncbi:MAG: hypothetical protein P8I79_01280, partial [Amylibacter sp.]|nr:hypothetical protein [Amylibacter sp.]